MTPKEAIVIKAYLRNKGNEEVIEMLAKECQKYMGSFKRSHIVMSGNFKKDYPDFSYGAIYGTPAFLHLLMHYCDKDHVKYGHYVVSPFTECEAHPNGSKECVVVWMPPHVRLKELSEAEAARKNELFAVSDV